MEIQVPMEAKKALIEGNALKKVPLPLNHLDQLSDRDHDTEDIWKYEAKDLNQILIVVEHVFKACQNLPVNQRSHKMFMDEMFKLKQTFNNIGNLVDQSSSKELLARNQLLLKEAFFIILEGLAIIEIFRINEDENVKGFWVLALKMDLVTFELANCFSLEDKRERPRPYPKHAVGLHNQIEEVTGLLKMDDVKNHMAVIIHGFHGCGKTTLADAVFSKIDAHNIRYSKITFLASVLSTAEIIFLQKQILRDLVGKIYPLRNVDDGQHMLFSVFKQVNAFIYIDNVVSMEHLEKLLPVFSKGIKRVTLLITTRDNHVSVGLKGTIDVATHQVYPLNNEDAITILSTTLGEATAKKLAYNELKKVLKFCSGIPSALEMAGKYIQLHEDVKKAYETIKKDLHEDVKKAYETIKKDNVKPNMSIFNEICKETLTTFEMMPREAKEGFIDICYFFNGYPWHIAEEIVGLDVMDILESKAFVAKEIHPFTSKYGCNTVVYVNDILCAFGIELGQANRVTTFEKLEMLSNLDSKEVRKRGIVGISIKECSKFFAISAKLLDAMNNSLRILHIGTFNITIVGQCVKRFTALIYLQWKTSDNCFDLARAPNLRFLKVLHIADGNTSDFQQIKIPHSVVYLSLEVCDHDEVTPRLDIFELSDIFAEALPNLRSLRLKGLEDLRELGTMLKGFSSLRVLDLEGCIRLSNLPECICNLSSLCLLNLRGCRSLKFLPEKIGDLSCLEALDLKNCDSLDYLPQSLAELRSLKLLNCKFCCSSLPYLEPQFSSLLYIERLFLTYCTSMEKLPTGFSLLPRLKLLKLNGCVRLRQLCDDFSNMASLEVLDLSYCPLLQERWMGEVLKIKTLKNCYIQHSKMLVIRWNLIRLADNSSFKVQVHDKKEGIEKMLSWYLFSKPCRLSTNECFLSVGNPLLLLVEDAIHFLEYLMTHINKHIVKIIYINNQPNQPAYLPQHGNSEVLSTSLPSIETEAMVGVFKELGMQIVITTIARKGGKRKCLVPTALNDNNISMLPFPFLSEKNIFMPTKIISSSCLQRTMWSWANQDNEREMQAPLKQELYSFIFGLLSKVKEHHKLQERKLSSAFQKPRPFKKSLETIIDGSLFLQDVRARLQLYEMNSLEAEPMVGMYFKEVHFRSWLTVSTLAVAVVLDRCHNLSREGEWIPLLEGMVKIIIFLTVFENLFPWQQMNMEPRKAIVTDMEYSLRCFASIINFHGERILTLKKDIDGLLQRLNNIVLVSMFQNEMKTDTWNLPDAQKAGEFPIFLPWENICDTAY